MNLIEATNYFLEESEGGITVGHKSEHNTLPDVEYVIDNIDSDPDPDDEEERENYKRGVAEEILDHLGGIYESAENIPVYRCVAAEDVDLDEWAIGESWSAYLDSAKEFGRHLGSPINKLKIISGFVPRGNVDWKESVKLYAQFSDLFSGESEFELRIPAGNIILDVKVEPFKTATERK